MMPLHNSKQKSLKRMKMLALSVLVIALVGYIAGEYFHIGVLKAFCEAAMVGGLADWFAVVALFRHPLGIPIPHTALIPKNKDKIGINLGTFVSEEFLTREKLEPKLDEFDTADKIAKWLSAKENAQMLSHSIAADVIPGILKVVNDDDVKSFIKAQFQDKLMSVNIGKWVGTALDTMTSDGRHQKLFTSILEALHDEFHWYSGDIHSQVSQKTPKWTFHLADKKIADGIISGIDSFLKDAKESNSDVRLAVDRYIYNYIDELKESPEMQKKINNFISELASNKDLQEYIDSMWYEVKGYILKDLERGEESKIKNVFTNMFQTLGRGLEEDEKLKEKINSFVKQNLLSKLIDNRAMIGSFIASAVKGWDKNEISKKLELEIGKDLQFIRINGAVAGGFVGVIIYAINIFVF